LAHPKNGFITLTPETRKPMEGNGEHKLEA